MQTRVLGRSDVRLSEIALGTWGLGSGAYGPATPATFEAVVKAAWDAGVTTFDVAPLWGSSEQLTAAALGEHAKDAVFISRAGRRPEGAEARFDAIVEDVEASLLRLGRDHLDVLLLHNPSKAVLDSDAFRSGIEQLTATGKIRAWGASIVTPEEARAAMMIGASAIGIAHHLLDRHPLHDLRSAFVQHGAGAIVRSPLAHGLLAGAWDAEHAFAETDHRRRRWDRDALAVRLEQTNALRFLAPGDGPDLATAALRFALTSQQVATVCVGARSVAQIEHAARASCAAPYLPPEALARLLALRLG